MTEELITNVEEARGTGYNFLKYYSTCFIKAPVRLARITDIDTENEKKTMWEKLKILVKEHWETFMDGYTDRLIERYFK